MPLAVRFFLVRSHLQPQRQGLYQQGASASVLGFLRQWEDRQRLLLLTPSEMDRLTWGEIFEVAKSRDATRVVFNCVPRDAVELHLWGASTLTPSGHALSIFILLRFTWRLFPRKTSQIVIQLSRLHLHAGLRTIWERCFVWTNFLGLRCILTSFGATLFLLLLPRFVGPVTASSWATSMLMTLLLPPISTCCVRPGPFLLQSCCAIGLYFRRGPRAQAMVVDDRFSIYRR